MLSAIPTEGFDNLVSRFDLVGSGGVYSTVEDLYRWDQNFYHNVLGEGSQSVIETIHQEGLLNSGESSGYAFALVNDSYKGLKTVSHSGSLAGYRAYYVRFPDQKFSVIILANRDDAEPSSKAYKIADLYLADSFEEPATDSASDEPEQAKTAEDELEEIQLSEEEMQEYTGIYYSSELDVSYEFYEEGDQLQRRIGFSKPAALIASGNDIFSTEWQTYHFTRNADDIVNGFTLDAGRVTNLRFEKQD